jgi:hypothetical protein
MPADAVRKSPTEKILEETIKKVSDDKSFSKEVIEALAALKVKDFSKGQKRVKFLLK